MVVAVPCDAAMRLLGVVQKCHDLLGVHVAHEPDQIDQVAADLSDASRKASVAWVGLLRRVVLVEFHPQHVD